MTQPVLHRVYIGDRSQFVDEALIRKRVLDAQWRTQWSGVEGRCDGMGEHALALNAAAAITRAANAPCEILGNGIAAVAQLPGWRLGRRGLDGFRLVAQQHPANDV